MEILDPDLWNDDGTPKRPSQQYMRRLEEAQDLEAVDPETQARREAELAEAYALYRKKVQEDKPAMIGDVVHMWDGECRAAIVLGHSLDSHDCEVQVFVPNREAQWWHCAHDEKKSDIGTWHWPEAS